MKYNSIGRKILFMKLYANCTDFMINCIYLNYVLNDKI